MEYSDPYEAWKESHGGSGAGYQPPSGSSPAPAGPAPSGPAPSGPASFPAPPSPSPAGSSGAQRYFSSFSAADQQNIRNSWGGKNLMEDWYQNAVKAGATNGAGAQAPGTGVGVQQGGEHSGQKTIIADPSKSLREQGIASGQGEEGWSTAGMPDRTGMRAWARENGMSEDFDRFDENQLLRWQDKLDSKCPPKTPFQADDGSGCVEKPIDSNKPGGVGGQGFAAGGGGGGGGGAAAAAGSMGGGATGLDADLQKQISGLVNGTNSRYTPEAMQGLLSQIKQQMEASKANQLRQSSSDAAGRGMSRAGATRASLDAIRRGAEAGFTTQYAGVLKSKIDADMQDKLAGLDRAQKYIDSLRDNIYRNDLTAMQREQFKANLALAYANIKNQREMLTAQAGYGMLGGGV